MSITAMHLLNDLRQKGYSNFPFPLDKQQLKQAIAAFLKFLDEPEDIKEHINFSIAPNHRRGDIGFKHREASDHLYNDNKDFFHFHPSIFERYHDFLLQHKTVADFMYQANSIWHMVYDAVRTILHMLEPCYPGTVDKVFATEMPHIQLRFLKYHWQKSGKYLAKPHFDAGSFTLAIAESCPGLRIGRNPETLEPVEHHEGHAVFMISSNYKNIINSNDLFPGWHDVIQVNEELIGQPFARWALVAFIEAQGVEALPRTETHKWYPAVDLTG